MCEVSRVVAINLIYYVWNVATLYNILFLYTVAKMQGVQVSFMAIVFLCLVGQEVFGQIPIACSDVTSLENLACCPATSDGVCGQDASKGQCTELNLPGYDRSSVDARHNWPHYFTRVSTN